MEITNISLTIERAPQPRPLTNSTQFLSDLSQARHNTRLHAIAVIIGRCEDQMNGIYINALEGWSCHISQRHIPIGRPIQTKDLHLFKHSRDSCQVWNDEWRVFAGNRAAPEHASTQAAEGEDCMYAWGTIPARTAGPMLRLTLY